MTEALYHIIISPVHLLIETVFDVLYDLIGNAGLAIVAVSLVVNILVLPLYLRADRVQEAERLKQKRMAPGIAEAMRAESMRITPKGMLSRAVSGIRKKTLIVNMPGSPKACRECLDVILDPLDHGLGILRGSDTD